MLPDNLIFCFFQHSMSVEKHDVRVLAFSRLPFLFFLKSLRCHLGSHRSGSGLGPGFSGSKFLGRRSFRLRFFFSLTAPFARSASEGRFLAAPLPALLPVDHSIKEGQ